MTINPQNNANIRDNRKRILCPHSLENKTYTIE